MSKHTIRAAGVMLAVILLAGCVALPPSLRWQRDTYTKAETLRGAIAATGETTAYLLAARMPAAASGASVTLYTLSFSTHGTEWKFIERAIDSEGRMLAVEGVDRKVGSGPRVVLVHESGRIYLTRAELERYASEGKLDVRLSGRRGVAHIFLKSEYIRGFLAACDAS